MLRIFVGSSKINRIRKAYFLVILISVLHFEAAAQNKPLQVILGIIDSFRSRYNLPGITATLIKHDGTSIDVASGFSDTALRTPLKVSDMLLGGSTGKMYFAISILKLAQEHKLNLDNPISNYLAKYSWFRRLPNADSITIRELLNHSSGIQEYYMLGDFFQRVANEPAKDWRLEELLNYVFDLKPLFDPGTSFSYADTNYLLLATIIEEVTNQSAYDYIHENITDRVGLAHTVPSVKRIIAGLANGYSSAQLPSGLEGAMIRNGQLIVNPQFEWGGGGFATCSHDLAQLVYSLMNGKIISMKSVGEMKKEIVAAELGANNYYGLGLQIIKGSLGTSYGHSGWFPGYQSDVEYFPGYDVSIAVQMNVDHFSEGFLHPRSVVYSIMHHLIDRKIVEGLSP
ncbi:MAG TPA: serine hydrolase domain-containing protein [Chitinophagaceae bacterium]|jgi:D-alanyl-D-alanine carboxypeptidase